MANAANAFSPDTPRTGLKLKKKKNTISFSKHVKPVIIIVIIVTIDAYIVII